MCRPIVIDNGSGFSKAGFSGEDIPSSVFPTIVGKRGRKLYLGENVLSYCKNKFMHPIQKGKIVSWDKMEQIWHHTFYHELDVNPSDQPLLISENPLNSKEDREKIANIMFETFNVPSLNISNTAVLGLYSTGRSTGMVIQSGYHTTQCVPINDGRAIKDAIIDRPFGGLDMNEYMGKLLQDRGISFKDNQIVSDIKEKIGYITLDFQSEINSYYNSSHNQQVYELPDGECITIGTESFRGPELLFNPLNNENKGIHKESYGSILKCNESIQSTLLENIVLIGGNTMFPFISDRLKQEYNNLIDVKFNIISKQNRNYGAWVGGSIVSSLSNFKDMCLSKERYHEYGPYSR